MIDSRSPAVSWILGMGNFIQQDNRRTKTIMNKRLLLFILGLIISAFLAGSMGKAFAQVGGAAEGGHWLTVVFLDPQGKPIAGQTAAIQELDENEKPLAGRPEQAATKLEQDGKLHFRGIKGILVHITGTFPGGKPNQITLCGVPVDQDVRHKFDPSVTINIRVLDKQTGEPVKEYTISGTSAVSVKDSAGRFHGGVEVNEHVVDFTVTDQRNQYEPTHFKVKDSQTGAQAKEQIIYLFRKDQGHAGQKQEKLLLPIYDKNTGKPVAGATVLYSDQDFGATLGMYLGRKEQAQDGPDPQAFLTSWAGFICWKECKADSQGIAAVPEYNDKPNYLYVMAKGYEELYISPDKRASLIQVGVLSVPLRPGASVSGVIKWNNVPQAERELNLQCNSTSGMEGIWGLTNRTFISNKKGEYKVEGLSPGHYNLNTGHRVDASGKSPIEKSLELNEGENRVVNLGDDLGSCTLTGCVRVTGRPVEHEGVEFKGLANETRDLDLSTMTDNLGRYRMEGMKPGKYAVTLSFFNHTGLENLEKEIEVTGSAEQDILFEPHRVTAKIVVPALVGGATLTPEQVRLERAESENMATGPQPAEADGANVKIQDRGRSLIKDGRAVFLGTYQGRYRLLIEYKINSKLVSDFEIPHPTLLTLDNRKENQDLGEIRVAPLESLTITGKVLDEDGKPMPNARVDLEPERPGFSQCSPCDTTDQDGLFRMENMPTGKYMASVMRQADASHFEQPVELKANQQEVVLQKPKLNIIHFNLTPDEAGEERISDRYILGMLTRIDGTGARGVVASVGNADPLTQPIQDGRLTFKGKFMGQYDLFLIYRPDAGASRNIGVGGTFVFNSAGGEQTFGPIKVPSPGKLSLKGRVLDEKKVPLKGARVSLSPEFDWSFGDLSATTDEKGNYKIEDLKAGAYHLTVFSEQDFLSDSIEIRSDTTKDLIVLSPETRAQAIQADQQAMVQMGYAMAPEPLRIAIYLKRNAMPFIEACWPGALGAHAPFHRNTK